MTCREVYSLQCKPYAPLAEHKKESSSFRTQLKSGVWPHECQDFGQISDGYSKGSRPERGRTEASTPVSHLQQHNQLSHVAATCLVGCICCSTHFLMKSNGCGMNIKKVQKLYILRELFKFTIWTMMQL